MGSFMIGFVGGVVIGAALVLTANVLVQYV